MMSIIFNKIRVEKRLFIRYDTRYAVFHMQEKRLRTARLQNVFRCLAHAHFEEVLDVDRGILSSNELVVGKRFTEDPEDLDRFMGVSA